MQEIVLGFFLAGAGGAHAGASLLSRTQLATLNRVGDLAVGRGFADLLVTANQSGLVAQVDAGWRASRDVSAFAFARAQTDWRGAWAASAGVGVRW